MPLLRDVIQRNTLANRPAATDVPIGTLFYDTTNSILYRSNGTTWDSVEGAGGGGQVSIQFKDEGTNLGSSGTANVIDFVGSGVTASRVSDTITVTVSGGGGGAPTNAQYLTLAADATLTDERIFTAGTNIKVADSGAGGAYTISTGTENIAFTGIISPTEILNNQNDYNPTGLSTATVIRLNTDNIGVFRDITGLAGGASGRIIVLHVVDGTGVILKDESASSTAANRFSLGLDVKIGLDECAILQYDSTSSRWRAISKPYVGFTQIQNNAGVPQTPRSYVRYTGSLITLTDDAAGDRLDVGLASTVVTATNNLTLSNKTIDDSCAINIKDVFFFVVDNDDVTKRATFQVSGITAGATRTITVPNADFTLAPNDPSYLVLGTSSLLANERVLTAGTNISFVDTGAGGTLTISASGAGGGLDQEAVLNRVAFRA